MVDAASCKNEDAEEVSSRFLKHEVYKTLQIYFPGRVSHTDIDILRHVSNLFVCCTGDQSLTEALAAKKIFAYEILKHKQESFNNLVTFAESEGLLLAAEFLKTTKMVVNGRSIPMEELEEAPTIDMQRLGALFHDPRLEEEFSLLSARAFEKKNLLKNLIPLLN